jgi:hypothetical protein
MNRHPASCQLHFLHADDIENVELPSGKGFIGISLDQWKYSVSHNDTNQETIVAGSSETIKK